MLTPYVSPKRKVEDSTICESSKSNKIPKLKLKALKPQYVYTPVDLDDVEIELQEEWETSPQCLGTTMNKAALFLLIGELNKRCECGGRWEADVLDFFDVEHAYVMVIRCDNEGCQQSKI